MENNNNVIQFPREIHKFSTPVNEEEKAQVMEHIRIDMSEEIGDQIMQNVIAMFHNYGLFEDIDELQVKDAIFVEECIKAAVYRYKGIMHPMHDMIDSSILLPDEVEEHENVKEELTDTEESCKIDN